MKRVSSRQRLVSWDAFDATANEEYDGPGSSEDEEHQQQLDDRVVLSRKRERLSQAVSAAECMERENVAAVPHVATVVSSFAWEHYSPQVLNLDDVPVEVQIHIWSFLDLQGLRSVLGLNHKYRDVLLSEEAYALWMRRCRSAWDGLLSPSSSEARFDDQLNLPTAAGGSFYKHNINLPLMLSMTPANLPTKVDETMLGSCSRRSRRIVLYRGIRFDHLVQRQITPTTAELLSYPSKEDGTTLIRYTGVVGSGDRCIRSNHPLPQPLRKNSYADDATTLGTLTPSLFDLLYRGSKASTEICLNSWRPFVAPYVDRDHSLQVSPRMVAYFEVSILKHTPSEDNEDGPIPRRSEDQRDCVAVGIATKSFHCQTRMPGWDSQSFGYHGDDGGTFHASGGMVERFGPCFGTGDTVGCGIDYMARGIFFTLNGNFLGYGWTQIDVEFLENKLYGVVGIDTNDPVSVNYGTSPFQFDLTKFTKKHESLITPHYQYTEYEEPLTELPSYPEI
eukprot:scaffold5048_cov121-Cylindrotheca_fusiformis.AAC.17